MAAEDKALLQALQPVVSTWLTGSCLAPAPEAASSDRLAGAGRQQTLQGLTAITELSLPLQQALLSNKHRQQLPDRSVSKPMLTASLSSTSCRSSCICGYCNGSCILRISLHCVDNREICCNYSRAVPQGCVNKKVLPVHCEATFLAAASYGRLLQWAVEVGGAAGPQEQATGEAALQLAVRLGLQSAAMLKLLLNPERGPAFYHLYPSAVCSLSMHHKYAQLTLYERHESFITALVSSSVVHALCSVLCMLFCTSAEHLSSSLNL